MSLLKKNGRDKTKSVETPASGSSAIFRKSASFDSPGEGERPPSQQSGKSAGGNKKKTIPSFFSNLFGNTNKVPENEVKSEPNTPITGKAIAAGPNGKNSASRESINSVQSSSSFSFVNPSKLGGKRVKGKRIPVDDPNYGSTTNNGKSNDTKKSFGSTLDRIGKKMGLKKKYNLQSCESLQYIDACDDEPMPIDPGTGPTVAAISPSGSSQTKFVTSQGQPSSSSQIISKTIQDTPELERQNERSKTDESTVVNVEFSSNCLARAKHNIPPTKATINGAASSSTPEEPVKSNDFNKTNKTFPENPVQTAASAKQRFISSGSVVATVEYKPASQATPIQTKVAVLPSSSKPEVKTTIETKESKITGVESKIETKESKFTAVKAKVETKISTPSGQKAKTETKDSKPIEMKTKIEAGESKITEVKAKPEEKESNVTEVKAKPASKEINFTEVRPKIEAKDIKPTEVKAKIETKENQTTELKGKIETKDSKTAEVIPILSTNSSATPSAPTILAEPAKKASKPDNEMPCSSRTIFTRLSPPPPQPSTSSTAKINAPFTPMVNSNTWSNSNRRKRRAPLPPSGENNSPQKYTNGTSMTSDIVTDNIPNDVPSPSSRAAVLTKFKRIEESPPPTCGTLGFEIRPRKKEKSLEPPPVTRPASFAPPPYSGSNTLFSSRHHRYQQHKRSCSDGYSTNSKGRVHKPGKKKAPPPPNPFGNPDEPEDSTDLQPTSPSSVSNPFTENDEDSSSSRNSNGATATVTSLPPIVPRTNDRPPQRSLSSNSSNSKMAIAPSTSSEQRLSPSSAEPSLASCSTTAKSDPASRLSVSETSSVPPTTTTPISISSAVSSQSSIALTSTITFTSTTVTPTLLQPLSFNHEAESDEVLDEIRQNMLNDEQERQQLGLLQQNNETSQTASSSSPENPTDIAHTTPPDRSISPVPAAVSASVSNTTPSISETDIQSAQRALATLSASVQGSSTPIVREPADPNVKAKLVELKKEADKSPLNASRSKSRPTSIGSSIYESPLALLFGKSSSSNSNTGSNEAHSGGGTVSSTESSPKIPSKPWYKRAGPFLSSKPKHTTPIKPFSVLVKFSELDKEATRIVEENRRRSAEQRFSESDQDELDEMFSSTIAAGAIELSSSETDQRMESGHLRNHSAPTRVFTTAQVHPAITEETDNSRGEVVSEVSSATTSITTTTNNSGSSSPPSFQSVHAASKHRQIKPLLSSSPITHVRSEKLAIVQPQANLSASRPVTTSMVSPAINIINNSVTPSSAPTTTTIPVTVTSSSVTSSNGNNTASNETQWDCPRCTLKNPNWRILCEICFHRKDSAPCGSYISSLLQRVNSDANSRSVPPTTSGSSQLTPSTATVSVSSSMSESSARKVLSPTHSANSSHNSSSSSAATSTSVINTSPKSTTVTTNSVIASPSTHCIPSVVEQFQPNSVNPGASSTSHNGQENSHNKTPKIVKSTTNVVKKSDIPFPQPPPACENFLSQLPAKQDLAKEKLQGIKLHEDPELEELDIGKLREARLAYFQRRGSDDSAATPPPSASDESEKRPLQQTPNDLDCKMPSPNFKRQDEQVPSCNYNSTNNSKRNSSHGHKNTTQVATPSSSSSSRHEGKDNTQQTTEHQTFSDNEDDFIDSMLQLGNQDNTTTVANITGSLPCPSSVPTSTSSQSPTLLQNRYRPKLEAIREGSSQDYTYCYSSSEIAQIYENWQASQQQNNNGGGGGGFTSNKRLVGSAIPSGIISLQETHLLDQHQQLPLVGNIHPAQCNATPPRTHPIQIVLPPVLVDHQPYANNRLADSPEENYMNTIPTVVNVCATSSTLPSQCLSTFPGHHQHGSCATGGSVINGNCIGTPINQNYLSGNGNTNYENNNMNFNPGAGGPSSKISYEEYRRMGAIPKGYPFRPNDEWSSESSSDSSRGLWGRGGVSGYQDSLPANTRRGALEFSQPLDFSEFPDPTFAVGKLMKRLEAAIANGDHRLAATLAHDLALMKVNCVVSKINQPYSIRVYVEDRFMQQGPFLMQVSTMMTVRDLKGKVESDWGIPSGFQKWILGRKMAEDDSLPLSSFEMAPDSMAFLFLITPDIGANRGTDIKACNQPNSFPVSDPSPSTLLNASAGLPRNIVGRSDRKSISPARNVPSVPTGHTYEVIPEGGMQHLYNNLDNEIKPKNQPTPNAKPHKTNEETPGAFSKKTSSAVQTTSSSIQNKVKELTPPPPLPCRSPIPGGPLAAAKKQKSEPQPKYSTDSAVKPNEEKIINSSTGNVRQQQVVRKEVNEGQRQSRSAFLANGDNLSAASSITLSLQQKLAEFKAIAEQTFGKSGGIVRSRQSSKERSPAPTSSKAGSSDTPGKKNETNQTKQATRKIKGLGPVKSGPSPGKERLVTSAPGSIEKLTLSKEENKREKEKTVNSKANIPENRFNGVLLPSPETTENLKPPERLDKTKNNVSRVASPEKVSEDDMKNNQQKRDSGIYKKPPLPPQINTIANVEESPSLASPPTNIEKYEASKPAQLGEEAPLTSAPQPKPRVLRKQQSAPEKVAQVNETGEKPTTENISQFAPTPTPRTIGAKSAEAKTVATALVEAKENSNISPTPSTSKTPETQAGITSDAPNNQTAVDDFCQTTLPFPAPKHGNKPTIDNSSNLGNTQYTNTFISSVPPPFGQTGPSANVGLMRPSAFVSQIRPDANNQNYNSSLTPTTTGSSVLLPILTAHFTNASTPTTATPSIAGNSNMRINPSNVAHVHPLNITPKSTSTPTAYVTPSPSASSSNLQPRAFTKGGETEKKKDDSAQSYLSMLELMEKQDLICTTEDADCPVCFTSLPKGEGIVLRDCLHTFCKECLIGCVQYADDSTVKCPYRDNDYACDYTLQEREIKALVPSEIFEKYLARSVKLAENQTLNSYHCKTPDCLGWCVFEDDVNVFLCPVCKKRNCITCAAIHDGIDCQKYQRELAIAAETDEDAKQSRLMLEKMIQRGEALDCPACHVVLLKKWGCDWVRCSYCKTEICWVTKGFRWGKGGKGDVTGGCKCGVNGVKCHPKCTYCH